MNKKAIERIKGYCCEVTQEQWKELVRTACEVGVSVGPKSRSEGPSSTYRLAECFNGAVSLCIQNIGNKIIPFPDFLAKLRGSEEWTPKAGEMVDVSTVGGVRTGGYMGFFGGEHWVFFDYSPHPYSEVKPHHPTITRAEAEKELGKRIID